MINQELTETEINCGAIRLFYPPEQRMLYVMPIEVITMNCLESLFELTPSEGRLVRDKARRLEQRLIELGR